MKDEQEIERLKSLIKKSKKEEVAAEEKEVIDDPNEKNIQIVKEEERKVGKVDWSVYKEMFKYSQYGGACSIMIIVFLSILINLNSVAVSLFLAFTISSKYTTDELDVGG
jgi:hypothetical protein